MRYYLLVFLLTFSAQALEVDKIIDTNIKTIYQLKNFKEKKEAVGVLYLEISSLKKNSKLSDKDFYIATDFLKVLDTINMMDSPSYEKCFDSRVGVLSEFGVRSVDMSQKNLPDGAKKGMALLKLLCQK